MIGGMVVPDPEPSLPVTPRPWWAYLGIGIMILGAYFAVRVNIRQSTHMAEDRAAAKEVGAVSRRLGTVEAEVEYLHDFVRRVEARTEVNSAKVERVEQAVEGGNDGDDAP